MLEIGGATRLHLVVVAFGEEVLRSRTSNGIALNAIGVLHRKEVVTVGVV